MESKRSESGDRPTRQTTMRYATVVVDPGPNGFYPESQTLVESATVTRDRIHYVEVLEDGMIVGLYELHADPARLRSSLEALPQVLRYDIVGETCLFVYLHERATEPARTLFSVVQNSAVVVSLPFEYTTDGTLEFTIVGDGASLQRTLAAIADVVEVHLEKTGEYRPDLHELDSLLTDRQREILRLAVEHGYYDSPRRITHQALADRVGLSQSTVAEHLQKIEAAILPRVIR